MSIDIRFPNITAPTEAGKLQQMQSYMHQLVEQLNWALNNIDTAGGGNYLAYRSGNSGGDDVEKSDPLATFNDIKGLIIKSADIVTAYYEEINRKLSGIYVAESDFGTYKELTERAINETSTYTKDMYKNLQELITDIETDISRIDVSAYIKSGLLYYDDNGVPMYGLEIGQQTELDGVETFNRFARFTSEKLSFFDSYGNELAYISGYKMYISHVEIKGSLKEGGYVDTISDDGGIVTKWEGGV